jgi:hypothetical protein
MGNLKWASAKFTLEGSGDKYTVPPETYQEYTIRSALIAKQGQ